MLVSVNVRTNPSAVWVASAVIIIGCGLPATAGTAGECGSRGTVVAPGVCLPSPPQNGKSAEGLRQETSKLPLQFEPNRGQTDSTVQFLSRGSHQVLFLTSDSAVLALSNFTVTLPRREPAKREKTAGAVLRMRFLGTNPHASVGGVDELPGKANYFMGKDPSKWHTDVPTYGKVRYEQIYPGIDLLYYGNQRQLEYDFVIAPGADPDKIAIAFEGIDGLRVDAAGDLQLHTTVGTISHLKPLVYQNLNGVRREISGRYVVKGRRQIGFQVAAYDSKQPLVIDPVLSYSTYLGGSGDDPAYGIALDAAGNTYTAGVTSSVNFPTSPGAYQTASGPFQTIYGGGVGHAFITKLNPSGSGLVYSTYLGGSDFDRIQGIAVDVAGNAYVTGDTYSSDFPTTPGAFQTAYGGGVGDAFITKLNPSGSGLVYSTYLGGSGNELGYDLAVDPAGSVYVTGQTGSSNFTTTPGAYQSAFAGGSYDGFVTKLNSTGTGLVYSTYLGGSGYDVASMVTIDAAGNAYVSGYTGSVNFPVTTGAFQTAYAGGVYDAFVTKLNLTGSGLVYSTYIGGSGQDQGVALAVDSGGNAYVAGYTDSSNFPTTLGAFQNTFAGGALDGFVTKLNSTGSGLVYSTYLGGSGQDQALDLAIDTVGNAYIVGQTTSTDFPTVNPIQPTYGGGNFDAFVTKLSASGSGLVYSSYLGGSGQDAATSIALDNLPIPSAYVAGYSASTNFPTTPGAFQTTFGGGAYDAFVTKITEVPQCTGPTITAASASPNSLWPPNHKMVPVTVSVSTSGGCGAVSYKIVSVSSNEPIDADGDWVITGDLTLKLRAERLGNGNGRIYTITVECADSAGNKSTTTVNVNVSHDKGK